MAKNYRVDGMTCGGCASSVEKAIKEAAPAAMVEVDLQAKQVAVAGIDDDALVKQAVEGAGFTYGGPA